MASWNTGYAMPHRHSQKCHFTSAISPTYIQPEPSEVPIIEGYGTEVGENQVPKLSKLEKAYYVA